MKAIRFLLVFFASFMFHLQVWSQKIPPLKILHEQPSISRYIKLLDLEDKDALIIKYCATSSWDSSPFNSYIVFTNSGKVYRCEQPLTGTGGSTCIKKVEVVGEDLKRYWKMLYSIADSNMININSELLNDNGSSLSKEQMAINRVIDGSQLTIEFAKGCKYEYFSSYAPDYYCRMKSKGVEDMKKLLILYRCITNVESDIFKSNFNYIAESDTVYLYFDATAANQKKRVNKSQKNALSYIYYTGKCDSVLFEKRDFRDGDDLQKGRFVETKIVDDVYIERIKKGILDGNLIATYDRLLTSAFRRKRIYLIDKSLVRPNAIVLQEVFFVSPN